MRHAGPSGSRSESSKRLEWKVAQADPSNVAEGAADAVVTGAAGLPVAAGAEPQAPAKEATVNTATRA